MLVQDIGPAELPAMAGMLNELDREHWIELIGFVPGPADIARMTVGDPDYEPDLFIGAWVEGELAGCVFGVRRPWKAGRETTGYIKGLLVRPAFRGRGFAHLLLAECEQRLAARGADRLLFGCCAPWYLLPGIPAGEAEFLACLRAAGWRTSSERISLVVERTRDGNDPLPPTVSAARMARPGEADEILTFVEHHFSRSWAEETRPALRDGGPAFCCVLREPEDGPVAGFAAVHATNPGWFGPMGVRPGLQGRGLGGGLAIRAVQEAWSHGADRLFLPWVNENEAFYRHVLGDMRRILHIKTGKILPPENRP